MTNNVINQIPFLRTSREFPEDIHNLVVEVNKSYLEIASAVNSRTIGLFPTNRPAITGESFYFSTQRQQTLRQLYSVTSTANIPHGIKVSQTAGFTRMYGQFTDGTNWYGFIAGSSTAIAGQISFYITSTNIVFVSGAGAPTLTTGSIVLEWASDI